MSQLFLNLLLSHFIADFFLQPKSLIEWKEKNIGGVLLHGFIVLTVAILFLAPYRFLPFFPIALTLIFISHMLIDFLKLSVQKKDHRFSFWFAVDQLAHGIILFISFFFFKKTAPENVLITATPLSLFFLLIVLFTAVLDMAIFQLQREKHPDLDFQHHVVWYPFGIFLAGVFVLAF